MGFVGKLIQTKTLLRCVSSEEDYIAGRINSIGMRGKALLFIAIGICLMAVKMVISLSALILFVQQPCALTFYVHSPTLWKNFRNLWSWTVLWANYSNLLHFHFMIFELALWANFLQSVYDLWPLCSLSSSNGLDKNFSTGYDQYSVLWSLVGPVSQLLAVYDQYGG